MSLYTSFPTLPFSFHVLFFSSYYDDQVSALSTWLQLLSNDLLFKNQKHCCLTVRRCCIWFQAGAFLPRFSRFLHLRLTGVFKMAISMNVGVCDYLCPPHDELFRVCPASCPNVSWDRLWERQRWRERHLFQPSACWDSWEATVSQLGMFNLCCVL